MYYGSALLLFTCKLHCLRTFDRSLHVGSSDLPCVQNLRSVPLMVFEILGFKLSSCGVKSGLSLKVKGANWNFECTGIMGEDFIHPYILQVNEKSCRLRMTTYRDGIKRKGDKIWMGV